MDGTVSLTATPWQLWNINPWKQYRNKLFKDILIASRRELFLQKSLALESLEMLLLWTTVTFSLVISVLHELSYKYYVFSLLTLLINSTSFHYECIQLRALYCDLLKDKTWWSLGWMEHNFHVFNGFITPITYSVLQCLFNAQVIFATFQECVTYQKVQIGWMDLKFLVSLDKSFTEGFGYSSISMTSDWFNYV